MPSGVTVIGPIYLTTSLVNGVVQGQQGIQGIQGVQGIQGQQGVPGVAGASENRLIYICNIRRASNFSGTITLLSTIHNTTGKTFTWSSGGGVIAILDCSDTAFFNDVMGANIYMINNTPNNPLAATINGTSMNFGVEPILSDYRVVIEFMESSF